MDFCLSNLNTELRFAEMGRWLGAGRGGQEEADRSMTQEFRASSVSDAESPTGDGELYLELGEEVCDRGGSFRHVSTDAKREQTELTHLHQRMYEQKGWVVKKTGKGAVRKIEQKQIQVVTWKPREES